MSLFEWGKSEPENVPPSSEIDDVESARVDASSDSGLPGSAASEVLQAHRKRGRKPLTDAEKRERQLQKEKAGSLSAFDELYKPETWEGIMCAPADLALALSGEKEIWDLSEKERKLLGSTSAMTAKCFAVSDPKWLAVSMLCITILQVYGARATMHYSKIKSDRKENKPLESKEQMH